jgi:hypothetical protein
MVAITGLGILFLLAGYCISSIFADEKQFFEFGETKTGQ